MSKSRSLYVRYQAECEQAFPATIEFKDQPDMFALPVENLRIPGGPTIPPPLYFAGFAVSGTWLVQWSRRQGLAMDGITRCATPRWREKGSIEPFITPRLFDWPTGDFVIYFTTGNGDPRELKVFHENRDAILDRYLSLMKFPLRERKIIKTKLFKWYRLLSTELPERPKRLPNRMCLQFTYLSLRDYDSEAEADTEAPKERQTPGPVA
ncbi:hypothetical protein CC1G_04950 [Coprinopsis cinerea okayama7|uniref:Uncharacterized protein n=1 Tax=Coprinopsis cinerea (strain Okayama-7 / 130 / ATCC MYA-4618 / FGSC 9003) TaxID=240176 RepID=A8PFN8_COPC7|nr:hypothetical protein CC1G_04950 [Coprinopsis cinerea okayama7\|eukprot:XP_001841106.1 hypothetical protein CC1G_04950 [Coprinopsis cinerea okayama7\